MLCGFGETSLLKGFYMWIIIFNDGINTKIKFGEEIDTNLAPTSAGPCTYPSACAESALFISLSL
jgi:hypothetical protein